MVARLLSMLVMQPCSSLVNNKTDIVMLTLIVKGEELEVIQVELKAKMFADRENLLNNYVHYLKDKFWKEIMLTMDWSITLSVESKMNNK